MTAERERFWPWRKSWRGLRCIVRRCDNERTSVASSFCPSCQRAARRRNKEAVAEFKRNPPKPEDE